MEPANIHRSSEVTRLQRVLETAAEGLSIVGISGPGGVGKTFLLDHVLDAVKPESLGYLTLRANGANPDTRGDFFGVIDGQLCKRSLGPPADRTKDYFPHVREVAALHRKIVADALNELAAAEAPPEVKTAAAALLRAGRILNKASEKTRSYFDAQSVDDSEVNRGLDDAWQLVRGLKKLRESTAGFGPLRDLLGTTSRNRVKQDLFAYTASELRVDLSAALVGWETKDRRRATQTRIKGMDRLLLIVDDYEALGALLDDFLVGALVPELASAPFRTVLLILGRDDLEATHTSWGQHCRRFLREQIRLTPFDKAAARDLFGAAGIPEERWDVLFEETHGYPFLISLLIEEAAEPGANSVVFLRRFYDRTTRWMTDREREWFARLCYLERVDEDRLAVMFPKENVTRIQDWFELEPSIRDPSVSFYRVRPLVREKVLRYFEVRAPSRHKELMALAGSANA